MNISGRYFMHFVSYFEILSPTFAGLLKALCLFQVQNFFFFFFPEDSQEKNKQTKKAYTCRDVTSRHQKYAPPPPPPPPPVKLNWEQIGESEWGFYTGMPSVFSSSNNPCNRCFQAGAIFHASALQPACEQQGKAVENIASPRLRHSLVTGRWWLNSIWAALSARRRSFPVPSGSLCQLYPLRSRRGPLLVKWGGGAAMSSKCQLNFFLLSSASMS